jgi:hypothetical protein
VSGFSPGAGLIEKETPAGQMTNVECRIKEFYLFYLLKEQGVASGS